MSAMDEILDKIEETTSYYNYKAKKARTARAELATLRAQNAALVEALKPFAACAEVWDESDCDRTIYWARLGHEDKPNIGLTVANLLDARAAIAQATGEKTWQEDKA